MAIFPSLSKKPAYPLEESHEDSVIRSAMDAGYEVTRARFTRSRRTWSLRYRLTPTSDATTLRNFFQNTVKNGSESFTWVHPVFDTSHTVTFKEPIHFEYVAYGLWNFEFTLQEI